MADDGITELLDEVERKYCSPKATPTSSATGAVSKETVYLLSHHSNCKMGAVTASYGKPTVRKSNNVEMEEEEEEEEDLDKIISEIINEPEDTESQLVPRRGSRGRKVAPTRSSPVLTGHTSPTQRR